MCIRTWAISKHAGIKVGRIIVCIFTVCLNVTLEELKKVTSSPNCSPILLTSA